MFRNNMKIVFALFLVVAFNTATAQTTQFFNIAIGDTVSDGVPEPGAGNIENPFDKDVYTFTATAGQKVFFDALMNGIANIDVVLTDEDGAEIFRDVMRDQGVLELTRGGTYTLTVGEDTNDQTG
ncbi:MAG: hypothetical protein R3200_13735, partial [Xanthomonadales bacterium]|nr:hypothetical protein [Xanthomonadales bacterium]